MTPEVEQTLRRARLDLADARKVAAISLSRLAARTAYSAAFHAAEAYILARTGKVAKTHSGVRSEFQRLLRGQVDDPRDLGRVLKDGYRFKEMADYWVDPDGVISNEDAAAMIDAAERFIDRVAALLSAPHPGAKG